MFKDHNSDWKLFKAVTTGPHWIGLIYSATDGKHKWLDGSEITDLSNDRLASNAGLMGTDHCFRNNNGGKLYRYKCSTKQKAVCQIESE